MFQISERMRRHKNNKLKLCCGNNCLKNVKLICIILCAHLMLSPVQVQAAVIHQASSVKNHLENHEEAIVRVDPSPASWIMSDIKEKWKKTGLRFLTKVETDSSVSINDGSNFNKVIASKDFHIFELDTEQQDGPGEAAWSEKLRVHLMRKSSVLHPNMKIIVQDGDVCEPWSSPQNGSTSNCHYVGKVSSFNHSDSRRAPQGIALLSACTPTTGFSGLIIMEDGRQWYMEPGHDVSIASKGRIKREAKSEPDTLQHVLLAHSELSGHMAAQISDVLRVPLPQLEEAARLAAVDAEARRNLKEVAYLARTSNSDWDEVALSSEGIQGESSILTPFFYGGAMLPFVGRGDHSAKTTQAKKLASKKTPTAAQTTLLTPLETSTIRVESSTYSSASIENHSTVPKKQPRIVEIAVFTDEELYEKMKSKFKVDTTAQLKEYATAMINMMDVMYQHSTLGVELRFRLVYVEVMKRRPSSLKTNGGRAKAYLSSFCDYAGEKNANSAQWDHALLLTGVDLHEEGVTTTAGLAWAGTMCFRYYSCSISEGLNFASAYITTHEIGHSLGMEHDGVGISEECDSTKFIMSPTTGPGKVTWSSCSSNNLQDFIKYGTSELRGKAKSFNMISRPICLEELVSSRNKKSFLDDDSGSDSDLKLPGEKYDANFQCSLGMGSFFKPHFERHKAPFDNICWILYCGNGTHAISTHPALEGTPCDRKKYCRSGQCVKRPETT